MDTPAEETNPKSGMPTIFAWLCVFYVYAVPLIRGVSSEKESFSTY